MKAESNLKPSAAFEIETHGATATVILYDNVTKTTRRTDSGEETSYTFDRYTVETTARENLAEIVGRNTTSWLEYAKQAEYDRLAATVRAERDQLLAASDKEFALDRLGLDCSSPEMLLAALAGKIRFPPLRHYLPGKRRSPDRLSVDQVITTPHFTHEVGRFAAVAGCVSFLSTLHSSLLILLLDL